jgi:hypothetical protein
MPEKLHPREFTRPQLYDLVWSKPLRTIAHEFGLSDVGFAKACRSINVPLPPRGYWAKLKAKKPALRIPLPPRFPGGLDKVTIGRGRQRWYGFGCTASDFLEAPIPPEPSFEEDIPALTARVRRLVGRVRMPPNFDGAHPLITQLLKEDDDRRASEARWSATKHMSQHQPILTRRRPRILNAIFLAVQRLGCTPSLGASMYDQKERSIALRIGHCHVPIALASIKQRAGGSKSGRRTERLRFSIAPEGTEDAPKRFWDDGDRHKIESDLTDIIVALLIEAEERHRNSVVAFREWWIQRKTDIERQIAREKEEAERQRREEIEAAQRERIERLLGQAADLHRAETIRAYARVAEECVETCDQKSLERWVSWALAQADQIDPTKNGTLQNAVADDALGGGQ